MGEIDTKPIDPVQVALSLFGEKNINTRNDHSEYEKEKDVECLLKDLANSRLQLEAKDFAYKQALLKLEHYQKVSDELSNLLKQSEADREKYIEEYVEARTCIDELESKVKEMSKQLLEIAKLREQLVHVLNELKAAQEELLSKETDLVSAREAQLTATTQARLIESAANIEKENTERLLRNVSELKEAILVSNMAVVEAEKERCKILSEKDAEIDLYVATTAQAQVQLEDVKRQMEWMQQLEIQLLEKSIFSDLLLLELKEVNQLLCSSEKATFDANELVEEPESVLINTEVEKSLQNVEALQANKTKTKKEQRKEENDAGLTIFVEDEILSKKTEKTDQNPVLPVKDPSQPENKNELEILKKELEITTVKSGELRNRLEQAITRAEAAEKAKAAVEDQLRKWRVQKQEQKQKRKTALAKLKEGSEHKPHNFPTYEKIPATYQPLSKVLNMKF